MTGTRRFLMRMVLFLIGVAAVSGVSYAVLLRAFESNPALNAMILLVLLLGIIYIFRQVTMLQPEIVWLDNFRRGQAGQLPERRFRTVIVDVQALEQCGRGAAGAYTAQLMAKSADRCRHLRARQLDYFVAHPLMRLIRLARAVGPLLLQSAFH